MESVRISNNHPFFERSVILPVRIPILLTGFNPDQNEYSRLYGIRLGSNTRPENLIRQLSEYGYVQDDRVLIRPNPLLILMYNQENRLVTFPAGLLDYSEFSNLKSELSNYTYQPLTDSYVLSESLSLTGPMIRINNDITSALTLIKLSEQISAPPVEIIPEYLQQLLIPSNRLGNGSFTQLFESIVSVAKVPPDLAELVLTVFLLDSPSLKVRSICSQLGGIEIVRGQLRNRIQAYPRQLTQRTNYPKGTLPDDLVTSVLEGYDITQNQSYMSELASLIGVPVNRSIVRYGAKLLRHYPSLAIEFFRSKPKTSILTPLIRLIYDSATINYLEIVYLLTVGYPLIEEISPDRFPILNLSKFYDSWLFNIYKTLDRAEIIKLEPNIMEQYVLFTVGKSPDTIRDFAQSIGMIIPSEAVLIKYFLDNLVHYQLIITRSNPEPIILAVQNQDVDLNIYTDREILDFFPPIHYNSRPDLIRQAQKLLTNIGFMVIYRLTPEFVINTETTLLDNIFELTPPYLAYGNILKYRVYSLEEIELSFQLNSEIELIEFRKPDIPRNTFTDQEINQLNRLLNQFNEPTLINLIRDKIVNGLVMRKNLDRVMNMIRQEIKSSSPEVIDKVKNIFYKIFYAGMYMRKWKGPGSDYPVTELETRNGQVKPEAMILLTEVSDLTDSLPVNIKTSMTTLSTMMIVTGKYERQRILLFDMLTEVGQGEYCIRVASSYLIISSHYYLNLLLGIVIPNFEPNDLQMIG